MPTVEESVARIAERLEHIGESVNIVRKEMNEGFDEVARSYVRKEEFLPVKGIAYGLVGIISGGVVVAILRLLQI